MFRASCLCTILTLSHAWFNNLRGSSLSAEVQSERTLSGEVLIFTAVLFYSHKLAVWSPFRSFPFFLLGGGGDVVWCISFGPGPAQTPLYWTLEVLIMQCR